MPDAASGQALLRLMAWLSPAFPVGSFAYSSGLERAVHDGLIDDAGSLGEWIDDLLTSGGIWNDAVLLCEASRLANADRPLDELCDLVEALAGSLERHREILLQGSAFMMAARQWPELKLPVLPANAALCVAVGATAGANGIALGDSCVAWLQASVSNQIQAGIRLSVLGQSDAVGLTGTLEPTILRTARRAAQSGLHDLGASTVMAEIVAMRHEVQHSRLFRS